MNIFLEELNKAKRDLSKLVKKTITNKKGKKQVVYVKPEKEEKPTKKKKKTKTPKQIKTENPISNIAKETYSKLSPAMKTFFNKFIKENNISDKEKDVLLTYIQIKGNKANKKNLSQIFNEYKSSFNSHIKAEEEKANSTETGKFWVVKKRGGEDEKTIFMQVRAEKIKIIPEVDTIIFKNPTNDKYQIADAKSGILVDVPREDKNETVKMAKDVLLFQKKNKKLSRYNTEELKEFKRRLAKSESRLEKSYKYVGVQGDSYVYQNLNTGKIRKVPRKLKGKDVSNVKVSNEYTRFKLGGQDIVIPTKEQEQKKTINKPKYTSEQLESYANKLLEKYEDVGKEAPTTLSEETQKKNYNIIHVKPIIERILKEKKDLQKEVGELKTYYDKLSTQGKALLEERNDIHKEMLNIKSEFDSEEEIAQKHRLKNEFEDLKADLEDIEADIADITQEIKSVKSDFDEKSSNLNLVSNKLKEAYSKLKKGV